MCRRTRFCCCGTAKCAGSKITGSHAGLARLLSRSLVRFFSGRDRRALIGKVRRHLWRSALDRRDYWVARRRTYVGGSRSLARNGWRCAAAASRCNNQNNLEKAAHRFETTTMNLEQAMYTTQENPCPAFSRAVDGNVNKEKEPEKRLSGSFTLDCECIMKGVSTSGAQTQGGGPFDWTRGVTASVLTRNTCRIYAAHMAG